MSRAKHLLRSSVLVILFFALAKLTGLLRARLVGAAFGTGPEIDAFIAANQLPEVFFTVIAGGSLAAAFIPIYAEYLANESARKSAQLANTVLTLVVLILGLISAIGAALAPWLTLTLLVPDFSPELQQLTASIMRIILVQTTIYGISGVLSSILNAHQHFALPALAPLSLDIGYFVGLFLFVPRLGIHGLAWGTVLGGFLHIAIQVPALVRHRLRIRPSWGIEMRGVREIARLMLPRIVTLGTIQVADLFIIRLASGLPTGSTSGYFYGYALMQLPETLFGTAIALVVFPTLAEQFNDGDIEGLRRTAATTLRIIWMLTIPAAVGLVLLGRPIVALLLQGGAFGAASTQLVSAVLLALSLRVISEATLELVARLFYAQHDTRTPMFAYLGWLLANVIGAYLLVGPLGVAGLALSSTIAFTALAAALFILNQRRLGSLHERGLGLSALRSILAGAGMALAIWGASQAVDGVLMRLAIGGAAGVAAYITIRLALGGRELQALMAIVRRKSA